MKIKLDGPYYPKKRKVFDPDVIAMWGALIIGAVMIILLVYMILAQPIKDNGRTQIPRKELHQLQRYHGTVALKILGEKVWIWRGGDWVKVRRRFHHSRSPQHPLENLATATTARAKAQ